MKNNFKVVDTDCTGTSLICTLPGATNKKIKDLFGVLPRGIGRGNKYSEHIVVCNENSSVNKPKDFFGTGGSGIYTLYTSFGEWRIGGYERDSFVEELRTLILTD